MVGTALVMVRNRDDVSVDLSALITRLYDETLPRPYGFFLYRVGGNVAIAEDLTQETYLAAVRELRRGHQPDDQIRWLFGVGRHKLLDHYRRQGRDREIVVPWYDGIEDDVSIPAFDLQIERDRDRIVDALGSLPANQQAVMSLRYLDGWSVPEIAAALGKSVHATESLLARGRISFKRALTEGS